MKTKGVPVFMDAFMVSAILLAWTSPAEPPATVKSWLATWTGRPRDASATGDDAIGGQVFVGHAEELAVVLGEEAGFLEGIAVQQKGDALARGEFAALVLLGNSLGSAAEFQAVAGIPEFRNLAGSEWYSPHGKPPFVFKY